MSTADIVVVMFSVCNSLRLFAYLPQLVSVLRDRNGASGVSLTTWTLFALANGSTTTYAIVVVDDMRMGVLFACNTVFSFGIAFGTFVKRRSRARGILALAEPSSSSRY